MVTSVSTSPQAAHLEILNGAQRTSSNGSIEQNTSVSSKNNIEDTYTPAEDFNKTDSSYYSENWSLNKATDSLRGFKMNLRDSVVDDYKKQHPDEKVTPTGKGTPAIENYLASIDYEKEYEEYKQSRGCSSDQELTALNKTGFNTKENFVGFTSCLIGSIDSNKFGATASQIAQNSDLSDLAGFFNKFITSNGDKDYQENLLSDLLAKNAQNAPSPEEQAQAMKEKYNSSLISKYAS